MLTAVLLLAMAQVHVTIHVVPQDRCGTLAERLAFLEGRMASAEQLPAQSRIDIIQSANPPTQLPAPPNGCYAAPAAMPSAYAAPPPVSYQTTRDWRIVG